VSKLSRLLKRELWSGRVDDVLQCLALAVIPALILVIIVARHALSSVPLVLACAALVAIPIAASVGIWRRRRWGSYLAALLYACVAVIAGWPKEGEPWYEIFSGVLYLGIAAYFYYRAKEIGIAPEPSAQQRP
jgi:hypothetical protein